LTANPSSHRKEWESAFLLQMPCVAAHATKSTANPQATQNAQKLHRWFSQCNIGQNSSHVKMGQQPLAAKMFDRTGKYMQTKLQCKGMTVFSIEHLGFKSRQLLHLTAG
jgi:hypothetical protein